MEPNQIKVMKLGIAFSGGGIRGVAHIGVVKALEEYGIQASVVSGTSAGAIVASMYAAGMDSESMLNFVLQSNIYKTLSFHWPLKGFASLNYLKDRLNEELPLKDFSEMKSGLYITMTDLQEGKLEIASGSGNVIDYIAASCAIPMIFEPVKINQKLYVDGGVFKNLPASLIYDKCEVLMGINLMPKILMSEDKFKNLLNIAARTFEMSIWKNQQEDIPYCDLHLEIRGIHQYHIFNVGKVQEIFWAGYQTAQKRIPELIELINSYEKMKAQII